MSVAYNIFIERDISKWHTVLCCSVLFCSILCHGTNKQKIFPCHTSMDFKEKYIFLTREQEEFFLSYFLIHHFIQPFIYFSTTIIYQCFSFILSFVNWQVCYKQKQIITQFFFLLPKYNPHIFLTSFIIYFQLFCTSFL